MTVYTEAVIELALSTTTNRVFLPYGRYRMVSDVDFYINQGGATVVATTSDLLIAAGLPTEISSLPPTRNPVTGTDIARDYVAGITASLAGTVRFKRQPLAIETD